MSSFQTFRKLVKLNKGKAMATKIHGRKPKKVKVGTILDEEVFRRLKVRSAREGKPIATLIEEAVRKYEHEEGMGKETRLRALESVFTSKFNISDEELRQIMEGDYYDQ